MSKRLKKSEMENIIYIACLNARELRHTIKRRLDEGEQIDSFWKSIYETWERTACRMMDVVQEAIIRGEMYDHDAEFVGFVASQHMKDFNHEAENAIFARWPWKNKEGKLISWTTYRKLKKEEVYNNE